jgi:hypothetical protein
MNLHRLARDLSVKVVAAQEPAISEEVEHAGALLTPDSIGLVQLIPRHLRQSPPLKSLLQEAEPGSSIYYVRFESDKHSVNIITVQQVEWFDSLFTVGAFLNLPRDLTGLPEEAELFERRVYDIDAFYRQRTSELLAQWVAGRNPRVHTIHLLGSLLHGGRCSRAHADPALIALRSVRPRQRPSRAVAQIVIDALKAIENEQYNTPNNEEL